MREVPPVYQSWTINFYIKASIIEPFKELLGISKEGSKLIRNIVATRNYLTHYSENLESFSVEGENLWELCQKLELIFTLHFLKIIGFTEEEIKLACKKNLPLRQKFNK